MKKIYLVGDNIQLKTKEPGDYYRDFCGCSFLFPSTNPASYTNRVITANDCTNSLHTESLQAFASAKDAHKYAVSQSMIDERGISSVVLSSPAIFEVNLAESQVEQSYISKVDVITGPEFGEDKRNVCSYQPLPAHIQAFLNDDKCHIQPDIRSPSSRPF